MKAKLSLLVAASAALFSGSAFAANHVVADLSTLSTSFYTEGDTITLPSGSYTVIGDGIATVADNVVTCKKAGFTLLNSAYRICVVPHPRRQGKRNRQRRPQHLCRG